MIENNKFNFIADHQLRNILIRDYNELKKCFKIKASKSVLILSGSIIESILIEYFTHNLPNNVTKNKLLRMTLMKLIEEAEKVNLITSKTKTISIVIKDYRNLIHPGKEIREKENFSFETATISFSLLKIIIKELKENYNKKYGYRAEDIFNKILIDNNTHSIYSNLILNLKEYEKSKLFELLINHHINDNQVFRITDRYILPLKKYIIKTKIDYFCNFLLSSVEKDKKDKIIKLYEIFGSDLSQYLEPKEKEIVLNYMYILTRNNIGLFSGLEIKHKYFRKLFSYFGLYLDSKRLKDNYLSLLTEIVECFSIEDEYDLNYYYIDSYRCATSNLTNEEKGIYENYIKEKVNFEKAKVFYSALIKNNLTPF